MIPITVILASESAQPVPVTLPPIATLARDAFPDGEAKLMLAALVLEVYELQKRLRRLEGDSGGGLLIS